MRTENRALDLTIMKDRRPDRRPYEQPCQAVHAAVSTGQTSLCARTDTLPDGSGYSENLRQKMKSRLFSLNMRVFWFHTHALNLLRAAFCLRDCRRLRRGVRVLRRLLLGTLLRFCARGLDLRSRHRYVRGLDRRCFLSVSTWRALCLSRLLLQASENPNSNNRSAPGFRKILLESSSSQVTHCHARRCLHCTTRRCILGCTHRLGIIIRVW